MFGVTRDDNIRNELNKEIMKQVQCQQLKNRLRWVGHIMRKINNVIQSGIRDMKMKGRRSTGKSKQK